MYGQRGFGGDELTGSKMPTFLLATALVDALHVCGAVLSVFICEHDLRWGNAGNGLFRCGLSEA